MNGWCWVVGGRWWVVGGGRWVGVVAGGLVLGWWSVARGWLVG